MSRKCFFCSNKLVFCTDLPLIKIIKQKQKGLSAVLSCSCLCHEDRRAGDVSEEHWTGPSHVSPLRTDKTPSPREAILVDKRHSRRLIRLARRFFSCWTWARDDGNWSAQTRDRSPTSPFTIVQISRILSGFAIPK